MSPPSQAFRQAYPPDAGGGTTTVRAHTRVVDGKPVQVAEHQRAVRGGQGEAAGAGDGAEEVAQAAERPNRDMRTNDFARDIILSSGGRGPETLRLHHPSSTSGVTIGFGYDMGQRSTPEVVGDLRAIGVREAAASTIGRAAGLQGVSACNFVSANRNVLVLTPQQRAALFERVLGSYEAVVQRLTRVPLNSNQFSALVSLAYNIGPGAFARSNVIGLVNAGRFTEAAIAMRSARVGAQPGLPIRRGREADLFLQPEPFPG
jgi:hypothetical protein